MICVRVDLGFIVFLFWDLSFLVCFNGGLVCLWDGREVFLNLVIEIFICLVDILSWFLSDLNGVDLILGLMKLVLIVGGCSYVSWFL